MKKLIFILSVAIIAAVVFNSCKKENSVQPTKQEVSAKDKAVTMKIVNFKNKLQIYKDNPNLKDGQALPLDSAVWYSEALLNYTYDDGVGMNDFTTVSNSIEVPSENGQISYANLSAAYTELESILADQKNENSGKSLVLADVASTESKGNVTLVLTSGFASAAGGITPPTSIFYTDAATVIQNNVNATIPIPSGGYYYTNITLIEIYPDKYIVNNSSTYNYFFVNPNDPIPGDNWWDYRMFYNSSNWPNYHLYLNSSEINTYTSMAGGIIQGMYPMVSEIQGKDFIGMTAEGWSMNGNWTTIHHHYFLNYGNVVLTGGGGNGK